MPCVGYWQKVAMADMTHNPLWCFEDGPQKGIAARIMGRLVDHNIFHAKGITTVTYKPYAFYKADDGDLVILAKLRPRDLKKWKRIAGRAHGAKAAK